MMQKDNPIRIQKLSPEDVPLLQTCAELSALCLPEEAWSFQSFLSETQKPGGIVLVAVKQNREAVGFLTACLVMDTADLTAIAVTPSCRRQGIGERLLKELLVFTGSAEIFLEVRESNFSAVALYQKHGFQQAGIRKHFYQNPDENAILMHYRGESFLC